MAGAEAAMLAGTITTDHVRRLADAYLTNPDEYADDEARLVGIAQLPHYSRFDRVIRYWCIYAAPDDGEDEAEARRGRRSAHCSRTFDGMVVVDALLDPVNGEIFARELERLERELFEADVVEAKERVGPDFTLGELRRTPRQRIFRGATKTAVLARDLECTHPSCDVPAERCEIDHTIPSNGGLTVQENGRCRCKYHHRRTPPPP